MIHTYDILRSWPTVAGYSEQICSGNMFIVKNLTADT